MQKKIQSSAMILFLDIDGVLNSNLYFKNSFNQGKNNSKFDAYSVLLVRKLVEEFSLKIVITSHWRNGIVNRLMNELKRNELINYLHEDCFTPILRPAQRGMEIKMWLHDHPAVTEYVIIDDKENFLEEQKHRFVKTNMFAGMLDENYFQAREILLSAEPAKN